MKKFILASAVAGVTLLSPAFTHAESLYVTGDIRETLQNAGNTKFDDINLEAPHKTETIFDLVDTFYKLFGDKWWDKGIFTNQNTDVYYTQHHNKLLKELNPDGTISFSYNNTLIINDTNNPGRYSFHAQVCEDLHTAVSNPDFPRNTIGSYVLE